MLEEKRKFSSSSEDHLVSNTFFSFSGKVLSTAFHHPALLLGWLWWRMKCCPPSFALRREHRNPLEAQSSLPPCPIIFGPHYSPSLSSPHLGRRRGAENTSYILPSGRKGKQLAMTPWLPSSPFTTSAAENAEPQVPWVGAGWSRLDRT